MVQCVMTLFLVTVCGDCGVFSCVSIPVFNLCYFCSLFILAVLIRKAINVKYLYLDGQNNFHVYEFLLKVYRTISVSQYNPCAVVHIELEACALLAYFFLASYSFSFC